MNEHQKVCFQIHFSSPSPPAFVWQTKWRIRRYDQSDCLSNSRRRVNPGHVAPPCMHCDQYCALKLDLWHQLTSLLHCCGQLLVCLLYRSPEDSGLVTKTVTLSLTTQTLLKLMISHPHPLYVCVCVSEREWWNVNTQALHCFCSINVGHHIFILLIAQISLLSVYLNETHVQNKSIVKQSDISREKENATLWAFSD